MERRLTVVVGGRFGLYNIAWMAFKKEQLVMQIGGLGENRNVLEEEEEEARAAHLYQETECNI